MRSARTRRAVVGVGLAALAACGRNVDGVAAPSPAPAAPPAACRSPATVALTVKNVLARCAVEVDGASASTAIATTVCVPPGVVSLTATPGVGFALGATPWHDTDGDRGAGDPGTRSSGGSGADATVTVSGTTACAWACCPLPDGSGCPAADQCP